MPLYDFKCRECGKVLELLRKHKVDSILLDCVQGKDGLCTFDRQPSAAKSTWKFADRSGLKTNRK